MKSTKPSPTPSESITVACACLVENSLLKMSAVWLTVICLYPLISLYVCPYLYPITVSLSPCLVATSHAIILVSSCSLSLSLFFLALSTHDLAINDPSPCSGNSPLIRAWNNGLFSPHSILRSSIHSLVIRPGIFLFFSCHLTQSSPLMVILCHKGEEKQLKKSPTGSNGFPMARTLCGCNPSIASHISGATPNASSRITNKYGDLKPWNLLTSLVLIPSASHGLPSIEPSSNDVWFSCPPMGIFADRYNA